MSILKGGIIRIAFNLGYQTRCEDCLARDFCIKIYQSDSGQSLYLAAENISIKETWTEAIHSTLSKIRLAQRKSAHKDRKIAEARNQYISRPVIYVKVIRARSLFSDGKSDGSSINPFVKVVGFLFIYNVASLTVTSFRFLLFRLPSVHPLRRP